MDDNPTHIFGLPPLVVALISMATAVSVLLTYHCLVARWCNHQEFVIPHQICHQQTNRDQEMPSSIDTSIAELIPSYKYTKDIGMVSKTQDATCAVCLCEFMDGEPVRVLPECLHPFHVVCIDMWLYSHSNGPVCRTDSTLARAPLARRPESDALRLPPDIRVV